MKPRGCLDATPFVLPIELRQHAGTQRRHVSVELCGGVSRALDRHVVRRQRLPVIHRRLRQRPARPGGVWTAPCIVAGLPDDRRRRMPRDTRARRYRSAILPGARRRYRHPSSWASGIATAGAGVEQFIWHGIDSARAPSSRAQADFVSSSWMRSRSSFKASLPAAYAAANEGYPHSVILTPIGCFRRSIFQQKRWGSPSRVTTT